MNFEALVEMLDASDARKKIVAEQLQVAEQGGAVKVKRVEVWGSGVSLETTCDLGESNIETEICVTVRLIEPKPDYHV